MAAVTAVALLAIALTACGDVVVHHGNRPDSPPGSLVASPGTPYAGLPSAPAAAQVDALSVRPLSGGSAVSLGSVRGPRATVVAFWATYCTPCVEELPGLQRLSPALERQGARVVLVDFEEGAGRARGWLADHRITLPAYFDPGGDAHDGLGLLGVPTTAVLAADGSVVARLEGTADNAGLGDVLRDMGLST